MKKVVVGMSGGVDSSVSAAILVEKGYEVTGVFLDCWREPGCRTDEDRKDALAVALKLGIPFKVLDFKKEYKEKVVDYFYEEYRKGRTPNPDVVCNREIKFGMFYDWALENGFDGVATGHYARIAKNYESRIMNYEYKLLSGVDKKKDQTYFLYRLRQEQLKHILFPIGGMTKDQVRKKARELELPVADKPDSQGICFIGPVDVQEFLRKKLKEKKGGVVDKKGKVIGSHAGVWFYTIGQRHGFEIKTSSPGQKPLFVVGKEIDKNRLVVGTEKDVYRDEFWVDDIYWISRQDGPELKVRIRHGGELVKCDLEKSRVRLGKKLKGIAEGQSAVFYSGEECLGGGTIFS